MSETNKRLIININGHRCRGIYEAATVFVFGTNEHTAVALAEFARQIDEAHQRCINHAKYIAGKFTAYAEDMTRSRLHDHTTPLSYSTLDDLHKDAAILEANRRSYWTFVSAMTARYERIEDQDGMLNHLRDVLERLDNAVKSAADVESAINGAEKALRGVTPWVHLAS